jgi:serine/threonine protein kinase
MNERDLFSAALEIEDPAERAAWLNQACAADAALRQRVAALVDAHKPTSSFLERPAAGLVATIDEPPLTERLGTWIGPYKLLQQIGEGGMGVVYMAEQTEPVRRKVALKIIKPGMDSQQVIALRGRAAGAGDDGPPEHRPRPRRWHDWRARLRQRREALLCHGAGPRRAHHQVLRRQQADAA